MGLLSCQLCGVTSRPAELYLPVAWSGTLGPQRGLGTGLEEEEEGQWLQQLQPSSTYPRRASIPSTRLSPSAPTPMTQLFEGSVKVPSPGHPVTMEKRLGPKMGTCPGTLSSPQGLEEMHSNAKAAHVHTHTHTNTHTHTHELTCTHRRDTQQGTHTLA